MTSPDLFKKYDIPSPRYTSYPTVPYWETSPTREQWVTELNRALDPTSTRWSMYLHLPFCESLCTFCGCNTSITRDHKKEEPYIDTLLKEWDLYVAAAPALLERELIEMHLGGGTPTFFSPGNLDRLLSTILKSVRTSNPHLSIEVDPRRTTVEHLKVLRGLGFNRVSMGVQDFNPEVQKLVNRFQPQEVTEKLTVESRALGFESVNFDLIYGLPKQTLESIRNTAEITVELRPDRIALYSFAFVPWIKPSQRLFTEADLPTGEAKRKLYETAREILLKAGYFEIGMDHFALPTDSLYKADQAGTMHRNFMGYTDRRTSVMLGLGVSSISETPTCFHQNEKVLPVYEREINSGLLATHRGHLLTKEDQHAREQILQLMTQWKVQVPEQEVADLQEILAPLVQDGLVHFAGRELSITPEGRPFLRNACMAFDRRMRRKLPQTKIFSQAL